MHCIRFTTSYDRRAAVGTLSRALLFAIGLTLEPGKWEMAKLTVQKTHRRWTPVQPWITLALLRCIDKRNLLLKHFLKIEHLKMSENSENSIICLV